MNKLTLALVMMAVLTVASALAAPQFGPHINVKTYTTTDDITISGEFIDAPEGAEVQLFCNNRMVGAFPIIAGEFTINAAYGGINGCAQGTATLQAGEALTNVNIPAQIRVMPTGGSGGSSAEEMPASAESQVSEAQGVIVLSKPVGHMPEYSTMTLGLAILGAGLGIAFLRKR